MPETQNKAATMAFCSNSPPCYLNGGNTEASRSRMAISNIPTPLFEEEEGFEPEETQLAYSEVEKRCIAAKFQIEEIDPFDDGKKSCAVVLPCGRAVRKVYLFDID